MEEFMEAPELNETVNPLIWAIYMNHGEESPVKEAKVQQLLASGADPNEQFDGKSALYYAVKEKLLEIVKILLAAGADINTPAEFENTVLYACINNARETWYSSFGRPHNIELMIESLLQAGADLNVRSNTGESLLHIANNKYNPICMTALLNAGLNVDSKDNDGRTTLHYARYDTIINILINAGADLEACDNDGLTPLQFTITGYKYNPIIGHNEWLISYGKIDAIRQFIMAGASTTVRDRNDNTLLHLAMYYGYIRLQYWQDAHHNRRYRKDLIELLIEKGLDVNARNSQGETPLMLLVNSCDVESVATLCTVPGIQLYAKDIYGLTALHRVVRSRAAIKEYEDDLFSRADNLAVIPLVHESEINGFIPKVKYYDEILALLLWS